MNQVADYLKTKDVKYRWLEHPAVFSVPESRKLNLKTEGTGETKNLFMKNKKGNRHCLVVIEAKKKLDTAKLKSVLGERMSFTDPECLYRYLKLTPGSVSPFGLLNDTAKEVTLIVDTDLLGQAKIGFHPNQNTATVIIDTSDWLRLMDELGNKVIKAKL